MLPYCAVPHPPFILIDLLVSALYRLEQILTTNTTNGSSYQEQDHSTSSPSNDLTPSVVAWYRFCKSQKPFSPWVVYKLSLQSYFLELMLWVLHVVGQEWLSKLHCLNRAIDSQGERRGCSTQQATQLCFMNVNIFCLWASTTHQVGGRPWP